MTDFRTINVWDAKLTTRCTSLVMEYLQRECFNRGTHSIKISAKAIGEALMCSEATAKRALRKLDAIGWIRSEGSNGIDRTKTYYLVDARDIESEVS